jgi:predicted alpha/beta-fold hydrolase
VTQAGTLVEDTEAAPSWLTSFEPHPWLTNGHLQTIVGNFLPRPAFTLPAEAETVEVDPADGSRVLCHCHWQPEPVRAARLTAVLVHGLNGSSNSRYIRGVTSRAWDAGMNVVRMNMRNCGGSEALTPTLYHSGRSADVGAVVRHFTERFGLERVALVGYSMGGNMVLKLAGEWGEWGTRGPLVAVATVCPAIDLAKCADALHETPNLIYERHFLRALMKHFHHKAGLFPGVYRSDGIGPVRSIREFDQKIVAPHCGFTGADDYYYRSASARVIDGIRIPTLVLRAQDDPFIRLIPETREGILANPNIELIEPRHGGHCAFLSGRSADGVHWAEAAVIRYLRSVAEVNSRNGESRFPN